MLAFWGKMLGFRPPNIIMKTLRCLCLISPYVPIGIQAPRQVLCFLLCRVLSCVQDKGFHVEGVIYSGFLPPGSGQFLGSDFYIPCSSQGRWWCCSYHGPQSWQWKELEKSLLVSGTVLDSSTHSHLILPRPQEGIILYLPTWCENYYSKWLTNGS